MTDICVSLETAKKLKAAGFPQDCVMEWYETSGKAWTGEKEVYYMRYISSCAAPTLQEILEELPRVIGNKVLEIQPCISVSGGWYIYYVEIMGIKSNVVIENDSLVEAAAALWLWCKENNYLQEGK